MKRTMIHAALLAALTANAMAAPLPPKPAQEPSQAGAPTARTAELNRAFGASLPLADQRDFDAATRGLIATMPDAVVKDAKGGVVWDSGRGAFVRGEAPASVNPSLWRQETLNGVHGLFKVADGIYQLRSYDLANMTLVAGKTGWIVIDPMLTAEAARAALGFARQQLGDKPVVAVIYTHSHLDHFGGVRGVIDDAEVKAGKVRVIAPEGFMESAVAENVLAGNAMTRRAQYQFGTALPWNERGMIGTGLGKATSVGSIGLIAPTETIAKTGQRLDVDGVPIVFQMANGTEAPSEMTFYFPQQKALCLSEVVSQTMHNIYTLRGARMRDALGWSKYINEMLDLFPDAEVGFRSHHWPTWGRQALRQQLVNQRDTYRFIHDEALHLANQGKTAVDLGNADFFPRGLRDDFSTHGYYGTLSHNLRGVFDFYLGWYDGNPATLNPLPRRQSATRYVEAMGGARAVLSKAQQAYDAGDYRWVAEMVNHLVYAQPDNQAARAMQVKALEQLGYQAESGVWRNEYLTAAQELREGVKRNPTSTQGADLLKAVPLEMMFDFMSVRLDHQKSDGRSVGINLAFTDSGDNYALELSNSVLNNTKGRVLAHPDVTLRLSQPALFKMLVAKAPLAQMVQAGEVKLEGDPRALSFLGNLVDFDPLFKIVTP
ncbi:alkyl/aryl-sulfatase [Duganella sp. S19_KUP01_CR8]|uniref:alkyl/aryl-sulfatase n=1 Tax=Duganella sp. S19_KUP01_CR8 TaxID=3025502 RepID=UPI002FCD8E5C